MMEAKLFSELSFIFDYDSIAEHERQEHNNRFPREVWGCDAELPAVLRGF